MTGADADVRRALAFDSLKRLAERVILGYAQEDRHRLLRELQGIVDRWNGREARE